MTRQGTVIRHTLLDSDTYAAMPDNVRSVFLCLTLAADDWGRLPDNPLKLNRMIAVCCKLPEEIIQCVDWMLLDGCLCRYRVGEESYLRLANWEKHQQRLKSRDRALYPAPDGEIEGTTNPLGKAKQSPDGAPHGIPDGESCDTPGGSLKERKGKERNSLSGLPDGENFLTVQEPDKPAKKFTPYRLRQTKTPTGRCLKFWFATYYDLHTDKDGDHVEYMGDIEKMSGQVATLLKKGTKPRRLCQGMWKFLDEPNDQFTNNHSFDTFIGKPNKWMDRADDDEYLVGWEEIT